MPRLLYGLLAGLVPAACTSTTAEPSPNAPADDVPTPAAAAVVGAAGELPPAEPPDEDPPATSAARLHLVASGTTRVGLHPLFGDDLAISVGPELVHIGKDDRIVFDPALLVGMPHPRMPGEDAYFGLAAWHVLCAGGRWPDEIVMASAIETGFRSEDATPNVLRYDGERWRSVAVRGKHYDWYPAEVHPWIEGSLLVRRVFSPYYRGQESWDETGGPTPAQEAAAVAAIGKAKPIIVMRGRPKAPDLGEGGVAAFHSWESGEILVVTLQAQPELRVAGRSGVESATSLPVISGTEVRVHGMLAATPTQALVYGLEERRSPDSREGPYLVRWDLGQVEALAGPPCEAGIGSLERTADGTLWATCGDPPSQPYGSSTDELWRQAPGEAWNAEVLPPEWGRPRALVVARGDLWVSTDSAIFRSRPAASVTSLPSLETIGDRVFEYTDPIAVDEHCSAAFIRLDASVADAAKVEAALEAAFVGMRADASVTLYATTIAGEPTLGLQFFGPVDKADVAKVERAVRRAEGVRPRASQCFFSREARAEQDGLAEWSFFE